MLIYAIFCAVRHKENRSQNTEVGQISLNSPPFVPLLPVFGGIFNLKREGEGGEFYNSILLRLRNKVSMFIVYRFRFGTRIVRRIHWISRVSLSPIVVF